MCQPYICIQAKCLFVEKKKKTELVTPRCTCQMVFDKRHEGLSRNWLSANDGFIPRCVNQILYLWKIFVSWSEKKTELVYT